MSSLPITTVGVDPGVQEEFNAAWMFVVALNWARQIFWRPYCPGAGRVSNDSMFAAKPANSELRMLADSCRFTIPAVVEILHHTSALIVEVSNF